MKVIFLDIDGVLNSQQYDVQRSAGEGNIDVSRLELIKKLVDRTDAKVVLTSSWRRHWDPTGQDSDETGKELEAVFGRCGIKLYGKTPVLNGDRPTEVRAWLDSCPDVESFVIIDDIKFGWGILDSHTVKTDYRIGRGITEAHLKKAIEILAE